MKMMEKKEWLILNSIIYRIYAREDSTEMRREFLENLKMVIDFDSGDFFLADSAGALLSEPVFCNSGLTEGILYAETEPWPTLLKTAKTRVCRMTDVIEDENWVKTDFYKSICIRNNWHYTIQMFLAFDNDILGLVTLYRTVGKENFTQEDIFILDILKEHLVFRLEREKKLKNENEQKLTVEEAVQKFELTGREDTVLRLLMQGKEHPEICDLLNISENTLKKHILSIYRKTGIRIRVQLFKKILEHNPAM